MRAKPKDLTEYINITPNWAPLVAWMLRVLEDPRQPEKAKQPLRDEIMRLARAMDAMLDKGAKS